MHSTQNLITNGGFSRMPADPGPGWDFARNGRIAPAWRRIEIGEPNPDGLPHSAFAARLEPADGGAPERLSQTLAVAGIPARRFVLRATACGTGDGSGAALVVAFAEAGAPGGGREIARRPLDLGPRWRRYRLEFEVPAAGAATSVSIALQGPSGAGATAMFTDVRLVGLLQPADPISVRFDTRGDLARASSRLRAFLLEDYLDLIGCRTSLNGGHAFDLLVCQKVQPWLRLAVARTAGRPVVFDLDDNDLLISRLRAFEVRRFARLADGVTLGSDFLLAMARGWNPRTLLLDNPVDVLDREVVRDDEPWRDRLVWFGMPENRWMLERLRLDRPVTTITRGGDIEYRLRTIDRDLVTFDLALLPVALNDETRAKNANRLVKCVALGLPFLATDTPEHRRALAALGLPDDMLLAPDSDWNARIGAVARRYDDWRGAIAAARPRAFDVYGIERIAAGWLAFCAGLLDRRAAGNR